MNPVCGSKRRINHATQVCSIRLGYTFHHYNLLKINENDFEQFSKLYKKIFFALGFWVRIS